MFCCFFLEKKNVSFFFFALLKSLTLAIFFFLKWVFFYWRTKSGRARLSYPWHFFRPSHIVSTHPPSPPYITTGETVAYTKLSFQSGGEQRYIYIYNKGDEDKTEDEKEEKYNWVMPHPSNNDGEKN